MTLTIKKFGYSSNPWRFAIDGAEFRLGGQPHFCFPRKRDAKPFYEKLLAVGDWSKIAEFTDEQKQAVVLLSRQTESYRRFDELMSRPSGW